MQTTARPPILIDIVLPGRGLARDVALIVGFSILVAVFAQIALRLPFTTVPLTGQTLAVLLAGGTLGAWRGAGALSLYMVWGTIGIPVFAPSATGDFLHFVLPWAGTSSAVWDITSGGYIVGFVIAAFLVGRLAERGWDRGWRVTVAMLIGNISLYIPGLLWLGYLISSGNLNASLGFNLAEAIPGENTLDKTLVGGLYPFILGDLIKLYIAAIVLPGAWAFIGRTRKDK
jgi:biotin transport system substrate-specific component